MSPISPIRAISLLYLGCCLGTLLCFALPWTIIKEQGNSYSVTSNLRLTGVEACASSSTPMQCTMKGLINACSPSPLGGSRATCLVKTYNQVPSSAAGDFECRDSAVSVEILVMLASCVQVVGGTVFQLRHFNTKLQRLGVRPLITGSGCSFFLLTVGSILWAQGPCLADANPLSSSNDQVTHLEVNSGP
eukprot:TRINITY_DN7126_c0_g1_i2.p1 TRINITY_DN7126_c0_g1~~TRINITY_DN7126_c0_g1_i2.p1  ORF type:complete len:199 (-),score=29.92 TRINITY_DN7126_c0_g1_i2:185-754(-)